MSKILYLWTMAFTSVITFVKTRGADFRPKGRALNWKTRPPKYILKYFLSAG
jgi:hypothetical protein